MEDSGLSKSHRNLTKTSKHTSTLYFPTTNIHPRILLRTGKHNSKILLPCFVLFFACLHVLVPVCAAEEEFPKKKCEAELPECFCDEGYRVGVELRCRNVSDFEHFTRVLSDGSVFEVNTTYDIILSGVRVLPRGFLQGLIVERLYIIDVQTELVEDGAFEGMIELKKFQVQLSSIKEMPDFSPVRSSLRRINLDNSRLTSISGDRLKNLTNLEVISFVNNSIQSVASDAFEGTENVMIFDLSYNQLKALPQNLFNSWKKLNKVSLTSNQLLHVDQLFAVARPKFIFLDHNNLTDLDSVLHPNMSQTQTLLLSYNHFSKITENSFNGKVRNVTFIYLDHCLIQEFNSSHFKDLPRLATLDLSYNLIGNVANQTIKFGSRTGLELIFIGNKIQEFSANLSYNVKHLNLNKNLLTSVSPSLRYSQVMDVNMADNRIENLGPNDFHGLEGVQNIDLQGNLISKVEALTFKNIRRSLYHLDLSRNRIRSLQGCVRNLYLLASLNLTGNMIESFEKDEFQGLDELLTLHLDGNRIATLGNEMQRLAQLQHLSLINNRIGVLKPEQIPRSLEYLYFEGNPFKCDCQLLPFLQYLNSSSLGTDGPLCTPPHTTPLPPPAKCPDGCHCFCSQNKDEHFMSVDCSYSGLTELPHLFTGSASKENFSSIAILLPRSTHSSQSGPFELADDIGGVNLAHNNLQSLEGARLPGGMRQFFLDDNRLQTPPLSLLYSLEKLSNVTLSGNPWSCDCDLLPFKEWILYKSEIVTDGNETRCGSKISELNGRVIWSLTDMDLCPVGTGSSTPLVIGLLGFLLVVVVIAIVLMVHWSKVKVWLFSHKYGVIQCREADNLLMGNQQRVGGTEGLVSFPLPDDELFQEEGRGGRLHSNGSWFQNGQDRVSTDRCVSLTSQTKLPM